MTLAFVVPGLDEAASEKAIAILQNRLSQEQEAALVLKHAHWNVTGPNFIAVHEMLDPEVEAVLAQADETAERIATLGGTPDGRADAITRNRTWKPFDVDGRAGTEKYLEALIEYYDAFIADDRSAVVGTINLDYRSLYHHFENAVWLTNAPCIRDIEGDFQATLEQCRAVENNPKSIWQGRFLFRAVGMLLKVIAPLL